MSHFDVCLHSVYTHTVFRLAIYIIALLTLTVIVVSSKALSHSVSITLISKTIFTL
uniref:Uncharacterized protein n=1 Tax=Anguilla anguilla TaxID=7936 RepID=A0A0E9WR96_ANGAN